MDPKEYAARLQRIQDEIETAKAREKISNGYNKAMEVSPMEDTAERLYAKFKATEKPKAKPVKKAAARPKKQQETIVAEPQSGTPHQGRGMPPVVVEMGKARLLGSSRKPAQAVNLAQDMVKPQPATKPLPAEERVKGLTPAQAETILSDAYSTRGRHGQYTPDESELMDALRAKAAGFDYGSVKQAPTAYVPSFLGGKK